MVGTLADGGDTLVIAGLVLLVPLVLVIGIPLVLAKMGASPFVVILGAVLNIGVVSYLMYYFSVIEFLSETLNTYR